LSGTTLGGRFAPRGCVTAFRSTPPDAKIAVATLIEAALRVDA
jgi:hypothetical protein